MKFADALWWIREGGSGARIPIETLKSLKPVKKILDRFERIERSSDVKISTRLALYGIELKFSATIPDDYYSELMKEYEGILPSGFLKEYSFFINLVPDPNRPARGLPAPVSFDGWNMMLGCEPQDISGSFTGPAEAERMFQLLLLQGTEIFCGELASRLVRINWREEFEEAEKAISRAVKKEGGLSSVIAGKKAVPSKAKKAKRKRKGK